MTPHSDETRARFLGAIADRVNPDAIVEVHLFQPIKQGGTESGVAVVAVREHTGANGAAEKQSERTRHGTLDAQLNPPDAASPFAASAENAVAASAENRVSRLAVFTAKYRLTQKGPERGKWEFSMHAEADAPLVTVDAVVRGVQRRSGDAEDPSKLTGDEFRELLPVSPSP